MEQRGDEPERVAEGENPRPDIEQAFRDGTAIDRALGTAIREALRMHKRLGNPVAVSRDGRIVWIPSKEIPAQP